MSYSSEGRRKDEEETARLEKRVRHDRGGVRKKGKKEKKKK